MMSGPIAGNRDSPLRNLEAKFRDSGGRFCDTFPLSCRFDIEACYVVLLGRAMGEGWFDVQAWKDVE